MKGGNTPLYASAFPSALLSFCLLLWVGALPSPLVAFCFGFVEGGNIPFCTCLAPPPLPPPPLCFFVWKGALPPLRIAPPSAPLSFANALRIALRYREDKDDDQVCISFVPFLLIMASVLIFVDFANNILQ